MPKRTKLNSKNLDDGDIYRISTFINQGEQSAIPYVLLEFLEDYQLDIGDYLTIDRDKYPKAYKSAGERVHAFVDASRNGYCYEHRVNDWRVISMFIPSNIVRIIN